MVDHHPVQTSAVYLLCGTQRPVIPPPSPPTPSPSTPTEQIPGSPLDDFCLDAEEPPQRQAHTSPFSSERICDAVHVLNTEAKALQSLKDLYEVDEITQDGFCRAVEAIIRIRGEKGKLVVIGVGKSGHIGRKLVATFNSLAIHSVFMHPTEALHGDLGIIGQHDTLLFITFSGKTPELMTMLPHIDPSLPSIIITSHTRPENCELIRQRPDMVLVPAPIHESETTSFGVNAPTTSTTMALAVGDALAIVASKELHASVSSVFARNHPGGAIGAAFQKTQRISDLATPLLEITSLPSTSEEQTLKGADILRAAYDCRTSWVRIGDTLASPSRIRRLDSTDLARPLPDIGWVTTSRDDWITIAADTRVPQAVEWIRNLQNSQGDEVTCTLDSVLAIIEGEKITGVLEVRDLLDWKE